jgi:fumarylacetoacetase
VVRGRRRGRDRRRGPGGRHEPLLKLGVFTHGGGEPRLGRLEDDAVLDLGAGDTLNAVMSEGLSLDSGPAVHASEVQWRLPFAVSDYVDFYSSLEHAANMGRILRPGQEPLTPNWRRLPIGYHGRAGTVVVGGTAVRRPRGQRAAGDFGPSRKLDFELELGFVVGRPSAPGEPVPVERALEHVFGAVLVNDWSARDIQAFEYVPLGPFLGKSFATSISPWVTTLDELARVPGPRQEPEPLAHLRGESLAFDVPLEVELNGEAIARTNAQHLYWSVAQQIAHLTSNGAHLRTGDLLATGTISGPGERERGSLIELTWNEGPFLADGDEVVLRGEPLGEVRGKILPA